MTSGRRAAKRWSSVMYSRVRRRCSTNRYRPVTHSAASMTVSVDSNQSLRWPRSRPSCRLPMAIDSSRNPVVSKRGLDAVFVKSGDGGNYWSQFSPGLVDAIHAAGVDVCAWQFVYGNDPAKEARVGARAVDAGADCLIIDAESDYEGKYASADAYVRKLRKRIGADFPLVLASFPYFDYHPGFPYSVFLAVAPRRAGT